MIGLRPEFIYPSQVIMFIVRLERQQEGQKGSITYMRKNGNQQKTNTPIMMPRVRAALRSLDKEILCFSSMNWCTNTDFLGTTPAVLLGNASRLSALAPMEAPLSSFWAEYLSSSAMAQVSITDDSLFPSIPTLFSDEVPLPGEMHWTSDWDSSTWALGTSRECWEHLALCLQRFLFFLSLLLDLKYKQQNQRIKSYKNFVCELGKK